MGMAASQARYLALTARKSNVEYEGQQINQSRTALANQTANLFSQMLGMSVPTPPSSTDYTTVQYSFSDGVNTEVLSDYYQLGTADSDYNYVVTTYHTESLYTGSKKNLNDPQVQATTTNNYSYDSSSSENNTSKTVNKAWSNDDGTYGIETSDGSTSIFKPVTMADNAQITAINTANGVVDKTSETKDLTEQDVLDSFYTLASDDEDALELLTSLMPNADPTNYMYDGTGFVTLNAYNDASSENATYIQEQGVETETDGTASATQSYYTDGTNYISVSDLETAVSNYDHYVSTGEKLTNDVNYINVSNDKDYTNYTAVGNCALTELKSSDFEDAALLAEIEQIIDSMQSDATAAANLAECFQLNDETGELEYTGGLYQFKMGGTTYYTTESDLEASADSSLVSNGIDTQQTKLSYYNATYIDTAIEETQKALLETDGDGRFTSVKFEDDSVVYTLNTETVTDEAAYNDAMNSYYYQNAVYEQTLSEINASTEVIQAQDLTLELRLEQLATEQSALSNEMEAVKKVVDDHVELGFKTFGG